MKILVPASSANLGPGFDSFGLAWQLYNEIFFEEAEQLSITGCDDRYRGEDNLACVAYRHVLEACGRRCSGLQIEFGKTDIPVSRGLGSSAALITAGVCAANALHGLGLGKDELLDLGTAVEGHPDNIAPALYGGLTVSIMEGEHAITRSFPLSDRLFFTLLIPPFELSTALSRSVMPREVSMRDAVFNLSRAALLPRALADGDVDLLRFAINDRLHQPYRFALIKGWDTVERLAHTSGAAEICISGAGSTLLCISDDPAFSVRMKDAMDAELPAWRLIAVRVDTNGAVFA